MSSLTYVERRPSTALAPFVECLWVVRDARRRARPRTPNRILPDGCPEWIIHAADVFERWVDTGWKAQPRSFLASTLTHPWLIRGGARVRTLGIRFKPGAAALLLDIDLAGTADREIDLDEVLKTRSVRLSRTISRARTTKGMLDSAETALLEFAAARLNRAPKTRTAVERIVKEAGRTRISALAKAIGISRRTLERRFETELGITPKQYARIVRFNAVMASVTERERSQSVDLALTAGYFDEAHLLREVRKLAAGRKLRDRAEADGDLARHFTRPARLRVLLERAMYRDD